MKLLIATDIHGSAYSAEKLVEKYNCGEFDGMVLLGDIYNHGPRNPLPQHYAPMEVAKVLSSVKNLVVIKGNCDSEVDQMISNFTFVTNNVMFVNDRKVFFTHGHIYNKDNLPYLNGGDVIVYGHFHSTEITEVNGVTAVCVGTAALAKDGKNVYAVLTDNGINVYDFDDNVVASKEW